jgi:uracil-DNA glycosylase family 4
MALHESALEELGLATQWVRRGSGQSAAAVEAGFDASADDVEVGARSVEGERVAVATPRAVSPAARDVTASAGQNAAPAVTARPEQTAAAAADHRAEPSAAPIVARAAERPFPAEPTRAVEPLRIASTPDAHEPTARPADANRHASPATEEPPAFPDDDFAWFDDLPSEPPSADAIEARSEKPALPAIDTLDWTALEDRVSNCERCRLCEKRTNTVFGVGDREADWMLIGEAPGENEDKQGEPFVGQAGKLLDNMLHSLNLARGTNVYIANVIKCRPPGNRNPEADEVARCEPYLQRQVALVKPKLIVALGRFAAQSLLKTEASISSLRGRVHEYEGVPVVVTYHPAYLLRSLPDKAKSWQDLCLARDTWQNASGGAAPSSTAQ